MSTALQVGKPPKCRSTGCLPCRTRKKKCDERKPTCLGCERNILICSWSDPPKSARPVLGIRSRSSYSASPEPLDRRTLVKQAQYSEAFTTLAQDPSLGSSSIRHPVSQMLYQYWIHEAANNMSGLQGSANAFVTELPKLAMRYPDTVLQSVLALSGVTYCNKHQNNPGVKELTWSHLATALRALKYALTRHVTGSPDSALPLLVTTLILCFVKTTRGDTDGNLQYHLSAARPLLASVLSSSLYRSDSSTIGFLKEYYAYVSCINDLTVGVDSETQVSSELEIPLANSGCSGVLGCAYDLFDLVPEISRLSRIGHSIEVSDDESLSRSKEIELLRHDLRVRISQWSAPAGSDQDFIICGGIYQQALLVYLQASSARISGLLDNGFTVYIENSITLLSCLPHTAPISATMCWPLAMIGSVTRDFEYRVIIRERLKSMHSLFVFGNITATIEFLDCLWKDDMLPSSFRTHPHAISLEGLMRRYGVRISFA